MKTYIQYLDWSTGYIAGTIPPRFDLSAKKLIPVLGSDGVSTLPRNAKLAKTIHKQAVLGNSRRLRPCPAYRVMRECWPKEDTALTDPISLESSKT